MTDYEKIVFRKGMHAGIRWTVAFLTRNARDLAKIGTRAEILKFALQRHEPGCEKGKDFADRLELSESRISNGVSKILEELDSTLNSEVSKQDDHTPL